MVFNIEIQRVAALRGGGRLFYIVSTDTLRCFIPYEIHFCVYLLLLRARVWALAGGFCVRNGLGGIFVFTNMLMSYSKEKVQLNAGKSCK